METNIEKIMTKVSETAAKKRGDVIDLSIEIENTLTDIITWCFYPSQYSRYEIIGDLIDENGIALKSLLLRKIDFRDKIETLKDVLLVKNPHIMEGNKPLINTIKKELDEVRNFRNLLAHSESDLSKEYLGSFDHTNSKIIDKFQVTEYRKGKAVKHLIDSAKYTSEVTTMYRVLFRLWQLFALINDDSDFADKYKALINTDLSS